MESPRYYELNEKNFMIDSNADHRKGNFADSNQLSKAKKVYLESIRDDVSADNVLSGLNAIFTIIIEENGVGTNTALNISGYIKDGFALANKIQTLWRNTVQNQGLVNQNHVNDEITYDEVSRKLIWKMYCTSTAGTDSAKVSLNPVLVPDPEVYKLIGLNPDQVLTIISNPTAAGFYSAFSPNSSIIPGTGRRYFKLMLPVFSSINGVFFILLITCCI